MKLELIKNPDESKIVLYKTARVIYAQTGAKSLRVVEALASMISNLAVASNRSVAEIVSDKNIFGFLNNNFGCADNSDVCVESNEFQMCLRTAGRLLNATLPDCCYGATRFHSADTLPSWATSLGYIADIDGILFYL